jgi:hypothetical protein
MSALYAMRYVGTSRGSNRGSSRGSGGGPANVRFGSVYIGRNIVVGVDTANARYNGTYTEEGGRLKFSGQFSGPQGGATLVTGHSPPQGQSIPLNADWPKNFDNGATQQIMVMGRPVQVRFEKIGDVP